MLSRRSRSSLALLALVAACPSACGGDHTARTPAGVVPPVQLPTQDYVRVVAFAGESIRVPGDGGVAPWRATAALPAGLVLVPTTGAIDGVVPLPRRERFELADARGRRRLVVIDVIAAPTASDRFVSLQGDDTNEGTRAAPFRTIQHAVRSAVAGSTIFVAGGRYLEDVTLRGVHGEPGRPVVLRSVPGQTAVIAGVQRNLTWTRASGPDAAPDEWISNEAIQGGKDLVNRGAFTSRAPFTRLLTYSQLGDLRARNQQWVTNDATLPGAVTPRGVRHAWTYFGPGLWHDAETGRIHLRLSPTRHGVAGLDEYRGPTDPAKAQVSVWARSSTPLAVHDCEHVEVRDLRVFGGGDESVHVEKSTDITLDHVDIDAATVGLTIGGSTRVRYRHGRIDGGIPPWTFRSDYKANYELVQPDGSVAHNNLVRKTSRGLVYVGARNRELELASCELENGHDIYIAGIQSSLHHCRIRNIHDEGMFVSHVADIDDLRIYENVFERVLSGLSGVGRKPTGTRYVYRNIFDLREPTAGYRPGASTDVWRWGHVFKGPLSASPFYFYFNTVIARSTKRGQPALLHFHELRGAATNPVWFVNNVVVVGGADPGPVSFVPDQPLLARVDAAGVPLLRSDGNVWIRPGHTRAPMFRCKAGSVHTRCRAQLRDLAAVRSFGTFEHQSRTADEPRFARVRSLDAASSGDDLRPGPSSPARGAAIRLPASLPDTSSPTTDAGALPTGAPPLEIGIDGRWRY